MTNTVPVYQKVLEEILRSLVNNPDALQITRKIDEMGVLLSIKAHPQDIAIIIGKKGSTINAIKHIIKAVGKKHFARVNIKVEEPTILEKSTSSLTSEQVIKDLKEKIGE